jgi:hypothetical protein
MSGSNRVAVLAADITAALRDISAAAGTIAERSIAAGHMLIEVKTAVTHGEWEVWLGDNVSMSVRTAQRYMRVAKAGVKSDTVAILGSRGAEDAIAQHPDVVDLDDDGGWKLPKIGEMMVIHAQRGLPCVFVHQSKRYPGHYHAHSVPRGEESYAGELTQPGKRTRLASKPFFIEIFLRGLGHLPEISDYEIGPAHRDDPFGSDDSCHLLAY